MGIFSRISDIVNSNLNALCDSAEDPEKMIRLIIQEMEDTLVEVRSASARVIAEQKTASRRRDRIAAEVAGWEDKAKLAVSKGRDDLAKAALQERRAVEETLRVVEEELTSSGEHIGQLNEEIGQLQQKLDDAKAKQKTILLRTKTVSSRCRSRSRSIGKSSIMPLRNSSVLNVKSIPSKGNCRRWTSGAILLPAWQQKLMRWVKPIGSTTS